MARRAHISAGFALILASLYLTPARGDDRPTAPKPFPVATVRFEQNATDGDVEVVFQVIGRKEGLAKLTVTSPDGRTVVDFTAPDASTMGIRQFVFESPEPTDVEGLKSAYPAGVYTYSGTTISGVKLDGKATLSHELPATISLVWPKAGAQGVAVKDLKIAWTPVKQVAGYIIEIEQAKSDVSLKARLPGSATSFAPPVGLLVPGAKYQLGIGTVAADGNVSFIETTFATAGKE